MRLYRDLSSNSTSSSVLAKTRQGAVVTLGNFDGVHLGHQALIHALHTLARPKHLALRVVSFTPHPRDYFASQGRGMPVLHIGSVRDRLTRLAALGVDSVHLLRFNHALATLSPQDFVQRVLVAACGAKHVVVGRDVRFGHQRAGDLTLLRCLGVQHGLAVHEFDEVVSPHHDRISSSTVRHALQAGDMTAANALLGYAYNISGRVIHGRKLGRTLGCPTLNLVPRMANPALRGICVVAIDGLGDSRRYGVASLGLRPTVEQTTRYSLEVHAFDWSGNAYGMRVTVTFLHKLRDEAAYIDLPTLQTAIEQDMLDARAWLANNITI
jgi:riboflavin kinase/FMN adenylyltransferase